MRWPTLWHRRAALGDAVVDREASGGASATVAEGPSDGGPPERPSKAWRELAPIERTVQDHPLTASTGAFVAGLAGPRMPDPILKPLGHDATGDGPSGLVSGLAVPLATSSTGSRSVHGTPSARGPQGRAGLAGRSSPLALSRRSPAGSMESAGTPVPEDIGEPAAAVGTADGPSPLVRNLTAVPDAALVAPRAYTLAAATSLGDLPLAARSGLDATAEPSTREIQVGAPRPIPGFEAPQPSVDDQRSGMAGLQPALRRTAEGAAEAAGHGPDQPAGDDRAIGTRGSAERPTLGQVRKMGLGAPLASQPDRMVRPPQPTPGRPVDAAPEPPGATRAHRSGAAALAGVRRAGGSAQPVTGGALRPMQTLPVAAQRSMGTARSDAVRTASTAVSIGPTSGWQASSAESEPASSGAGHPKVESPTSSGGGGPTAAPRAGSLPLVGDRLAGSTTQRAGSERPTTGAATDRAGSRTPGAAGRHDAEGVRSVARRPKTAPTDRTPTLSPGAEWPAPADGAALWSQAGSFPAPASGRPGATAPIAPALVRPRTVQRSASSEAPEPGLSWTPGLGMRPADAGSPVDSSGTPLQRSVTLGEVATEVAPASAAASRGAGQGAAPGGSPDDLSDQDIDLLARRIYGRIRDRLGNELLLDRERAGSLADL